MINNLKPLVTIGIPTYNRADGYLKQTLGSAVNQTYENIEIIVSDNCSTDNTESVVKDFHDPRIRYFKQKDNIIANDNFNFCLKQAHGVYFLLLHDDDLIDNDFVETCVQAANYSSDISIIRTGMRRIDSDGKQLVEIPNRAVGLSTEDFFIEWFRGKTPMHLCMSLFNTSRLRQIGGFNSKYLLFQDVFAEITLAAKFGRVDIEDVKSSYRWHSQQLSVGVNKTKAWCKESFILLNTACNLVSKKKEQVRKEGKEMLFKHNYNKFAKRHKSRVNRLISYFIICENFGYLYFLRRFCYPWYSVFSKFGKNFIKKRS